MIGENQAEPGEFLTNPPEPGYFIGFHGSFQAPGSFETTNFSQAFFQVPVTATSAPPPPLLVSVPEPGSLVIVGIGASLLAARRPAGRHRRRRTGPVDQKRYGGGQRSGR